MSFLSMDVDELSKILVRMDDRPKAGFEALDSHSSSSNIEVIGSFLTLLGRPATLERQIDWTTNAAICCESNTNGQGISIIQMIPA